MLNLTTRERNYVGCLGEIALAKRLNVDWSAGRLGWSQDNDVSGLEVRATIYANGCLRTWNGETGNYTLAVIYHAGLVRLAGWHNATTMPYQWDDCRYCPQRYLCPMDNLPVPPRLPTYLPPHPATIHQDRKTLCP